nr:hypothetical protein [Tanacetum cinerariifolium]
MVKTMEQYMSKTRADYGSEVARPKIEDKDNFELKGQFLKELRTNTFSGSDHEDANEHIEKVLEIVDLFHFLNITIDQVMLRAFSMSLTRAASHWLRKNHMASYGPQFSKAYSEASHINNSIPRKEKDPGSFNLPYFINNVCFDNAHADLGASISLRERMELDLEARLMGETLVLNRSLDLFFGDYIELNDLIVPLELRRDQVRDLMPTNKEGEVVEVFKARNDARIGDENPIRTLGDYSKPRYEGYRNTIELSIGNNVHGLVSRTYFKKSPSWHRYFALSLNFNDHVDPVTRRTIDQLAGGKLCDLNSEESWALLEDLTLYNNESWNDPRDFTKLVKAITLPQDVSSTSDRFTTLCEICIGPHDIECCMEDPEQAFVEYASSRTNEAGHARLSKFESDFKRQQCEMTNKIDTVLKAIIDQIVGTLPGDTVKKPKLSTSPLLSARSYPTMDPKCSSHPSTSINAIKVYFKEATISQTSLQLPVVGIEPQQPEEPEPTLEDEFQDLHLNLPVLKVLAHALISNAILDKYVESLELGKNRSAFLQGKVPAKKEDPRLFNLPCRLGESKPFDTLADLGSCVNPIPLYLFKKLNIGLLEETGHIFGLADETKSYLVGIVKDIEDKPPKNEDGAWHAKIRLIDLGGKEFTKTLQSILTTRKLFERESTREIIDLDHFHDTLYLIRRCLEVVRKFHWMILEGWFNQLLHVSSLLLSKPWEY